MTKEDLVNKNILRDKLFDGSNSDGQLGFTKLPFILGKGKRQEEKGLNDFESLDKQETQNG